jgi:glutaminyl-peptide cyclotransferase
MRDNQLNLFRVLTWALVLIAIAGCKSAKTQPMAEPESLRLLQVPAQADGLPTQVDPATVGSIPHDTTAFTQGLVYHRGALYESTGRKGHSKLRRLNVQTGEVEKETALQDSYFGEGLAVLDDKFYQLTWTSGVCLLYNSELGFEKNIIYGTEGWGLTVDPESKLLVFSDGSAEIRFLDPTNFITKRRLTVTDGNEQPVSYLNELEWVNGEIWANIWTSDTICRIDPQTGRVKSWLKLSDLVLHNQTSPEDVLNGIAYDPESDSLWLTGKLWPQIYKVENVKKIFFEADDA